MLALEYIHGQDVVHRDAWQQAVMDIMGSEVEHQVSDKYVKGKSQATKDIWFLKFACECVLTYILICMSTLVLLRTSKETIS